MIFGQISIFYKKKIETLVKFPSMNLAGAARLGIAVKKVAAGMGLPPESAEKLGLLTVDLASSIIISYKWKVYKLKQPARLIGITMAH